MIQHVLDGILVGVILSLGATGLTMVMHIMRFANFSHAEFLSIGAYSAIVFDQFFKVLMPITAAQIGPLSMTWALVLAIILAMVVTAVSAVIFDLLIFRRVREKGEELSMVFASFGLALIIRNVIGLVFGLQTKLFSQDIVFAKVLSRDPLILVKMDQLGTLIISLMIMLVLHLALSRTTFGFESP